MKLRSPAAARNTEPIREVLAEWLPASGLVVEVASGSGEHAVAFARAFSHLEWQPSDPDQPARASIAAWRELEGPANLLAPLALDVREAQWPIDRADALVSINMVHISPWQAALGLLDGAARLLGAAAPLILYGPWIVAGVETAPSNLAFDADLKRRDPRWGLRDVADFAAAAEPRGFTLRDQRAMPANNRMLLLIRR